MTSFSNMVSDATQETAKFLKTVLSRFLEEALFSQSAGFLCKKIRCLGQDTARGKGSKVFCVG